MYRLITLPYRRICLLAALAGAALSGSIALAQSQPQPPAEPVNAALADDAVRVVDFDWQDSSRNRAVPARLYWPQSATLGKVPLVVFSHGLGGSRMGYSHLGRYWASQGFASLHVQHLGSDRAIWGGNVFEMYGKLRDATSEDSALARAKDVSFAITTILENTDYAPRIDATEIAVAGHSYGANTALLLAGAQVIYQRKPITLEDPRIKAAIILSAPPFHGQGDMKHILAGVRIPTLHLTGTDDNINVPGYTSRMDDRVEVFDAVGAKAKLLAAFDGGTHNIFTDRLDRAGPALNNSVKTATRQITAAFLRTTLRGESPQLVGDAFARYRGAFTRVVGALPGLTM